MESAHGGDGVFSSPGPSGSPEGWAVAIDSEPATLAAARTQLFYASYADPCRMMDQSINQSLN